MHRILILVKVHNDDISNVLILNRKSISNHENQLFQAELEKFRPHQNRLLQATHKQSTLMKELTKLYGDLLQDKRVRSEQAKYEGFTRQRNMVLGKYKKIFQAFNDLVAGTTRAQSFYSEMRDTVESLEKNVETFVNNRRSEGAQLLSQIEREKAMSASGQADRERDRLRELMERISIDPSVSSSPTKSSSRQAAVPRSQQIVDHYSQKPPHLSTPYSSQPLNSINQTPLLNSPVNPSTYQNNLHYPSSPDGTQKQVHHQPASHESYPPAAVSLASDPYNPMLYPFQIINPTPGSQGGFPPNPSIPVPSQYPQHGQYLPQGYVPPPPPPGPPPNSQANFSNSKFPYPLGHGGFAHYEAPPQGSVNSQQDQNDPWAGLNAWK